MTPIEQAATRRRALIAGTLELSDDPEEARRLACFDSALLANEFLRRFPEIGRAATVPMFEDAA
jgi:hypothetical protein